MRARPGGHTAGFVEAALANVGSLLDSDPAVRARLQAAAESVLMSVLPSAQASLADLHRRRGGRAGTATTIVDKLELRVGRDLQYVRINGTLVGFLVGGLVYAVLRATFGGIQ